jgi:hypothetical protein
VKPHLFHALAPALALLAGCGSAPSGEAEPARPPAYPGEAGLIEFSPGARSMRFFVDAPSLSVYDKDGVVRYTLVARSPEGARNVSYESLSCATGQYRVHALGRVDGSWGGRESDWRPANDPWHRALYREYFCPQNEAIRSPAEGVRALQQGGHPNSRGFAAPGPVNPR